MLSTKFQFIRESSFRGEDFFQKSTNQKQKWLVAAMFVNVSGRNWQSLQRTFHRCFLPSFSSFGQLFQRRFKKNWPIRNNNYLWRSRLSMDRDKMSNLYREPSIDASYQISVHLGKRFQRRRFFRNQAIKNKNGLWRPCLLTDRN